MATLEFRSWKRSKVLADAAVQASGRLKNELEIRLDDTATGQHIPGKVPVLFTSAAEVTGLKAGAIRHLAPKPSTPDAETTKLVHVDFNEHDLPWRYSSKRVPGVKLFYPWIALLVGTTEELQVEGGVVTAVEPAVLTAHDLGSSHRWAHVQTEAGVSISRLLSPRRLDPQRKYVAAIVPAVDATGQFAWSGGVLNERPLRAFFSWQFWTGEEGDFETLATALKLRKPGDLGSAPLRYRRPVANVDETIHVRGAITSLQDPPDESARVLVVRADLDVLNNPVPDEIPDLTPAPPAREIILLPGYGGLWREDTDGALWSKSLNDDPRHRGVAGLGLWMGIVAQESLMDAAVKQAGALQDARQRIADLAFGLDAAARLWQRRLPDTPALRLRVFGPAMGRMLATDGGTILDRVTAERSACDAAIFSSTGQRLLRNGTARARFSGSGRIDRSAVFAAANTPPAPVPKAPQGLPHVDGVARGLGQRPLEEALDLPRFDERLDRLLAAFEGRRNSDATARDFAERVHGELALRGCGDQIIDFLRRDVQPPQAVLNRELLLRAIEHCLGSRLNDPAVRSGLATALPRPEMPDPRRSINLDALATAIGSAIDPTRAQPPAWQRVASMITGLELKSLAPPEPPIGLDYPTWALLNQHAREWLLPGVASIERDSIVALQTNPTFIDAFMVGINTQFIGEMRWRNLPAPRVSTPLRMFWGYYNHEKRAREADIQPIGDWPSKPAGAADADDVGALSHQAAKPGDPSGKQDLVILFKTPLFRRYPSTLVYLVRPLDGDDVDTLLKAPPKFNDSPANRAQRRFFGPIFFGQMEPDLVFFAFDVKPDTLDQYWLVLDEPPAELRFRSDQGVNWVDGAEFAVQTIDKPTRVAISGAALEEAALNG